MVSNSVPAAGGARPAGMWLLAPPDSGLVNVSVRNIGEEPQLHWVGTIQLINYAPPDIHRWPRLFLAHDIRGSLKMPLPHRVINCLADVDVFERTLSRVESVVRQIGAPCFNLPSAVRRTRRDVASELLQGIDGLVVPKTVRFAPRRPEDFAATFEAHGFSFPVIIRIAGSHGGRTQTLIEDPAGWDRVFALPWGGANVYMTQFVDYRSADGLYRKLRLAFIGGRVLARHYPAATHWMVHAKNRLSSEFDAEMRWLADFETGFGAERRSLFDEIYRRVGLDFFGVDCAVLPDGRLVLFEANATMGLLRNTPPHEAAFVPIIARLAGEVFTLMRDPRRWVCATLAAERAVSVQ